MPERNAISYPVVRHGCIAHTVADHAAETPSALALADSNHTLTYKELNDRASLLGKSLRACGVGADVTVGICFHSSVEMVVAALGVLKAGGAYLPLDPNHPRARIASILEDSGTDIVVAPQDLPLCLPSNIGRVVSLAPGGLLVGASAAEATIPEITEEELAYVIYTSGSTGKPKGVQISHRSLLNLIEWHVEAFAVTSADRASQIAGVAFDAAVWEIWPYLAAGASVFFADESMRSDPPALQEWLISNRITISFVPTIMAERIMAREWPANTALRFLLTGADTLHHFPSPKLPFVLVNNYGPTECTVVATSGIVSASEPHSLRPTIGKAIRNTQIFILDENLLRVSDGSAGEICIGGEGLARGYVNDPEMTQEKFIHNPFSADPHARLYRTGDMARILPNGEIEFLGRRDDQVKIRGHRIELTEVVSILNQHPFVRESAAIALDRSPEDKRLVAYYVTVPGAKPTHADLQDFLRTRLPSFMVPSMFVELSSLPLNSSGKLHRSELPVPDFKDIPRETEFIAPRSFLEERVAGILSQLLGLTHVGIEDNFFLLGGHSLLGTQLIARIRDAFGVELSLLTLFTTPTVAGISAEVERLILHKIESMNESELQRIMTPAKDGRA